MISCKHVATFYVPFDDEADADLGARLKLNAIPINVLRLAASRRWRPTRGPYGKDPNATAGASARQHNQNRSNSAPKPDA